ncbi:N-acetyltransferase family protein [Pollutibacter soli]|uniref:GNAT family N-acetyltransferase n=1 Tax=Pollutibacter soli TaxID=3034157 RepID=UPI0030134FF5
MSSIILRDGILEDLPQMLEIYNDIILNTTAVYDYNAHTLEMRTNWFNDRLRMNLPVIVAMDGEDLVGFGSFGQFRAWAAYKYAVEHSVYVRNDQRGRGIGKRILVQLINEAKKRNLHTMIAGIDASNDASIRLHEQLGFIEVGHFKEVGYKFNRWLDLKFLQLTIDNNPE